MLCIFHAIWQPSKCDIYPLCPKKSKKGKPRELSKVGSAWGEYCFWIICDYSSQQYSLYIQCLIYIPSDIYIHRNPIPRSHVVLTEMLQTKVARAILSVECISAVEMFQVVMREKQQYIAHLVRLGVSLTCHAASTSPVESIISNIKGTMGCSHKHKHKSTKNGKRER